MSQKLNDSVVQKFLGMEQVYQDMIRVIEYVSKDGARIYDSEDDVRRSSLETSMIQAGFTLRDADRFAWSPVQSIEKVLLVLTKV